MELLNGLMILDEDGEGVLDLSGDDEFTMWFDRIGNGRGSKGLPMKDMTK